METRHVFELTLYFFLRIAFLARLRNLPMFNLELGNLPFGKRLSGGLVVVNRSQSRNSRNPN